MGDRIDELAARVARGDAGAATELTAALREATIEVLERIAAHRHALVRKVAAEVAPGRTEPRAEKLARKLARDAKVEVRRALALALSDDPAWGSDELYTTLLDDADGETRGALIESAVQRESLVDALTILVVEDPSPELRARLCALLAERHPERAFPMLVENASSDDDAVRLAAAVALHELVKFGDGLPAVLALPSESVIQDAIDALRSRAPRKFARVIAELERRKPHEAPAAAVKAPPTPQPSGEELGGRAFDVERQVEALLAVLRRTRGRAAMLIGESGVGKTAIVHELARRELRPGQRPRIVRMSPADFLTGTKYLGEWETKLDELVRSLSSDARAVLYVPGAHELSSVGTTSQTTNNVAAALAPHIESGAIAVIGETTPSEWAAGLGRQQAPRRLWTTIEVAPSDATRTQAILRSICDEAKVAASDAVLERTVDYAEMFVGACAQPGQSAGLLRSVLAQLGGGRLTLHAVLDELARRTGVPVDLIDDEQSLDFGALRDFFQSRVMGQREAIDSVIDLVTLFKAGLNDPHKPLSVLLFVGPTGVGKTELARALAERIFGDSARLLRFDMSEFATYEAFERLHGSAQRQGLLTTAVREHPLSVVLFDEIEKAHGNVFDLCLQIFDAGRLTDGSGRTVDFRRCIVIMTSNLGAAVRVDPRLGFGGQASAAPPSEDVQRELRGFFRPEFLARIDRVVHFQPLSLESAEQIARKELARMLRRSGIERRGLSIDVDPALIALLLREGYTQAFGARPLKRTIERRVLLPVARAIASGPIESGAVLRLRASSAGEALVDILRPTSEPVEAAPPPAPANAEGLRERCAKLVESIQALELCAATWSERRSALVEASNAPGFWEQTESKARNLDELHRVDQLLERVATLAKAVRSLAEHARRARGARSVADAGDRASRMESQIQLLTPLCEAQEIGALTDAVVELTSVRRAQGGLDGVLLLGRMYRAWAKRHGLECETLSDRRGGDPFEDSLVLAIRGAGAHLMLRSEAGLHTLQQAQPAAKGRRAPRTLREAVRVDVHSVAEAPTSSRKTVTFSTRRLTDVIGRDIKSPTLEARAFDAARAQSATIWTDVPRDAALQHARLVLESRAAAPSSSAEHIVRRYDLGPSPLVRDTRAKTASGKLHRVLEGEIDEFLSSYGARLPLQPRADDIEGRKR